MLTGRYQLNCAHTYTKISIHKSLQLTFIWFAFHFYNYFLRFHFWFFWILNLRTTGTACLFFRDSHDYEKCIEFNFKFNVSSAYQSIHCECINCSHYMAVALIRLAISYLIIQLLFTTWICFALQRSMLICKIKENWRKMFACEIRFTFDDIIGREKKYSNNVAGLFRELQSRAAMRMSKCIIALPSSHIYFSIIYRHLKKFSAFFYGLLLYEYTTNSETIIHWLPCPIFKRRQRWTNDETEVQYYYYCVSHIAAATPNSDALRRGGARHYHCAHNLMLKIGGKDLWAMEVAWHTYIFYKEHKYVLHYNIRLRLVFVSKQWDHYSPKAKKMYDPTNSDMKYIQKKRQHQEYEYIKQVCGALKTLFLT